MVPIWRHCLDIQRHDGPPVSGDLRVVWAVRSLAETSWALSLAERKNSSEFDTAEAEIYVTGGSKTVMLDADQSVELAETTGRDTAEKALAAQGIAVKHGRPDLHEIVDEFCSGHIGRVAVLVCGPTGMYQALRKELRRQVWRGKNVYWHAESFGL
jgi:NAD(P)H-flavin reductase